MLYINAKIQYYSIKKTYRVVHIDKVLIERIQRRFTKMTLHLKKDSARGRLVICR